MDKKTLQKYIRTLVKEAIVKEYGTSDPFEGYEEDEDALYGNEKVDDDFTPGAAAFGHSGEHGDYFDNDREAGSEIEKMTIGDLRSKGFSTDEIMKMIMGEGKKSKAPILKTKSNKKVTKEQYSKVLLNRKALIESMISEKGLMDKIGGMFNKNPSAAVDDPKHVAKVLDGAIGKAQKFGKEFSAKVLNTSQAINAYHDAVLDALDKFASLSDTVPERKDAYEKMVMATARQFYQLLSNEKGRIESFTKTLQNDLATKGFDKSMVTAKGKPEVSKSSEPNLRGKEDVTPMNSLGKGLSNLATSWIK